MPWCAARSNPQTTPGPRAPLAGELAGAWWSVRWGVGARFSQVSSESALTIPICRAQADYYEQSVRLEAISNAKENDKSLANQRDAFVAEHEAKEQLLAQQPPGVLAKANALPGRGE